MKNRLIQTVLLALLAAPLHAQTLVVEGVVSPAWVERGGSRIPLEVGMPLSDQDKIRTGPGARALLRMAEGSAVKLGENATLGVDGLADGRGAGQRLVSASLDVARGAFRFTTDIFSRKKSARDIKIRIATITAGVRGTDVWGKSADDRDIVCLIEGNVSVSHPQAGEFTMSDPLSFFIAPKKDKPLPVAPVEKAQLKQWAAETDIQPGSGGATRGGKLKVDAVVAPDQKTALRNYDKLREAGFPAVIQPVKTEGGEEFRVRILNLPGLRDARAMVDKLKGLGMADAQVGR